MSLRSHFLRKTYWIKDFFRGSPIRSHYKDISRILNNPEYGKNKKKEYLDNLLKYAVENTPFYSNYDYKNLESFPVVNKTILSENFDKIKIEEDKIPFQKGKIFVQKTSGSTGTPFSVPQDTRKRNRRIGELKYFGEKAGFKSHEKLVHLRTWNRWQSKTKLQSIKENIIPFNIAQISDDSLMELSEIINKNHVNTVRGYASSIDLLAKFAIENKIKFPKLKLMIAGSEALLDSTREMVENQLGCNIISQYANEENGILAQENILDKNELFFQLNHASYYFEFLKLNEDVPEENGKVGRIVVTDLFNFAFPMIRYDTGDTAIVSSNDFDYSVITKLYGRKLDLVYDTIGDIVFPMAFARIFKHYSKIIQWQFVQSGKKQYCLKLIVKESFDDLKVILIQLKELLGQDADIRIKYTDDIPVLQSGKRKPVINKWK